MSKLKIKNGNTWEEIPAGGVGVPSGGTQGQVLYKTGSADYATGWGTASDIGAMSSWVKLWENASPTSSFAAQVISLDLSGYDAIAVYVVETNAADSTGQWFFYIHGQTTEARAFLMYNARQLRYFSMVNSGVQFSSGRAASRDGNLAQDDSFAIPRMIYGIKGVKNT